MTSLEQATVRNAILARLSPADFGVLAPHLEPVRLRLRDMVAQQHEPITHALFPERGMISILANTSVGQIEVGLIGREGFLGIPIALGMSKAPHGFMVQAEGDAYQLGADDLRSALKSSPGLSALLLRYVHAMLAQTASTAFSNASFTLESRLARWILMTHDRADGDELSLTHEFLSMMLGVARPGVTIAVQILEGNHLIRATRGRITVLNRAKLQDLADDSYGAAEAEYVNAMGEA
jgi:CRP-like cAMP-binding protein